ncbi:hypothetical protein PV328_011810 [Microctonus aethiopoides]|uniref:Uncharacterized protein n=1 Tax=Microctonus aethiopoides TaxID=144406 RepID=A0AA39C4A6_9HYME|nr:hypothetical protein PV328_011810 [Microctonus aethiopoides]
MEVIVDMQGFKWRNNEFIVKEFAMIQLDKKGDHGTRILFKPQFKWDDLPKQYKATNSWLIRNYHGIFWDDGDIPYEKLRDILEIILKDVDYIYVKDTMAYIKYHRYVPCEWVIDDNQYYKLIETLYDAMEFYVDVHLNYDGIVYTKNDITAFLVIDNVRKIYWFKRIKIEDDRRPPTAVNYHPRLAPSHLEEQWRFVHHNNNNNNDNENNNDNNNDNDNDDDDDDDTDEVSTGDDDDDDDDGNHAEMHEFFLQNWIAAGYDSDYASYEEDDDDDDDDVNNIN